MPRVQRPLKGNTNPGSSDYKTGESINAAEVNDDFNTLYNLVNGSLDNTNFADAAGIAYDKINFNSPTGTIIDTDIRQGANIQGSKLANNSVPAIKIAQAAVSGSATVTTPLNFLTASPFLDTIWYTWGVVAGENPTVSLTLDATSGYVVLLAVTISAAANLSGWTPGAGGSVQVAIGYSSDGGGSFTEIDPTVTLFGEDAGNSYWVNSSGCASFQAFHVPAVANPVYGMRYSRNGALTGASSMAINPAVGSSGAVATPTTLTAIAFRS